MLRIPLGQCDVYIDLVKRFDVHHNEAPFVLWHVTSVNAECHTVSILMLT